jgi:rRNA maturation RNase YbeY
MVVINFFNESRRKNIQKKRIKNVLEGVCKYFQKTDFVLNVVFVENRTIKQINKKFLNHNYVTDVISFDLSEKGINLGEIYICIDVAEHQAKEYRVSLTNELQRLAIHGLLHILGFDDSSSEKKEQMTELENQFLNIL